MFREEKDYYVVIKIELSTKIGFAEMDRESPITVFDAIDNAVGSMPAEVWAQIENGFNGEFDPVITFKVSEI